MVMAYEPRNRAGDGTRGGPFGLSSAIREIGGTRESGSLDQSIVERSAGMAGTAHAYLCLPNRESAQLRVQAGSGVFAGLVGHEFSSRRSLAGRARGSSRFEVKPAKTPW